MKKKTPVKKNTNTIVLNGKQYDAHTGVLVSGATQPQRPAHNVDGILTKPKPITPAATRTTVLKAPKSIVQKPVMDIARAPVKPLKHHAPQTAHTLMRAAVKKPKPGLKRHLKAYASTDALVKASTLVLPKLSIQQVDSKRLTRSKRVAKSNLISRFSDITSQPRLTVAQVVSHQVSPETTAAEQPSLDIFERALAHATGHQQKTPAHVLKAAKKQRRGRRSINMTASVLAFGLLASFVAYQNVASLKLQVASNRAGFAAALPAHRPSGFSLGKLTYQPGSVAIHFHSNSDQRAFAITEKASGWDSQTLRDNFVAATAGNKYEATETGGRTIYLYGDNNATWVNGGVWYQVETAGGLSQRQLLDLAGSM